MRWAEAKLDATSPPLLERTRGRPLPGRTAGGRQEWPPPGCFCRAQLSVPTCLAGLSMSYQ